MFVYEPESPELPHKEAVIHIIASFGCRSESAWGDGDGAPLVGPTCSQCTE